MTKRVKTTLIGYRLRKGRTTIETLKPDMQGRVEISRVKLPLREIGGLTQLAHGLGLKLTPIYSRS